MATEFVYVDAETGRTIVVPAGFICDGASIPRALWTVIAPSDLSECAWLLHDWLYRYGASEGWTRKEADRLFYRINREQKESRFKSWLAYRGVRLGGSGAFVRG